MSQSMPDTIRAVTVTPPGAASQRLFALWRNFFSREVRQRYLGSVTGLAWALVHPLALLGVYHFVFTKIFRVGSFGPGSFLAFVAVVALVVLILNVLQGRRVV